MGKFLFCCPTDNLYFFGECPAIQEWERVFSLFCGGNKLYYERFDLCAVLESFQSLSPLKRKFMCVSIRKYMKSCPDCVIPQQFLCVSLF